jgi:hypothetical protein
MRDHLQRLWKLRVSDKVQSLRVMLLACLVSIMALAANSPDSQFQHVVSNPRAYHDKRVRIVAMRTLWVIVLPCIIAAGLKLLTI